MHKFWTVREYRGIDVSLINAADYEGTTGTSLLCNVQKVGWRVSSHRDGCGSG